MKNIELNHKLNAGHLKSLAKKLGLMVDRIDSPLGFNESGNCVEFFGVVVFGIVWFLVMDAY